MKRRTKSVPSPSVILQRALKRKIERNPSYSMRALARDLGLSAPYLSRVLKGAKAFPEARFESFVRVLDLDDAGARLLKEAILKNAVRSREVASSAMEELLSKETPARSPVADYQESTHRRFLVLDHWYSLAILDLVTCVDFVPNPGWIAGRLGIPADRAERTFRQLVEEGLIVERAGRWEKRGEKIRFPTSRSHAAIRGHHQAMMKKAVEVMNAHTDDEEFERRLITSFTLAANPENLAEARRRLQRALFEIAEFLAEGECTEIYQINAQLFPLTVARSNVRKK